MVTNSDDSEIFHLRPEAGGKILQSRLRPCMRWRTGMRDSLDVEECSARLDLCKPTFKRRLNGCHLIFNMLLILDFVRCNRDDTHKNRTYPQIDVGSKGLI